MDITKYSRQTLFDRLVITKKSLIRFCSSVVLASGLLTALPVMSAPVLTFSQTSFTGVFGVDYPVLDFVVDINDGDPMTTDYFFEWILSSHDASGNVVDSFVTSVFNDFTSPHPLENSFGSSLFPAAGDYTLFLDMTTFHQAGGLPGCGPNAGCWDSVSAHSVLGATASMAVHLSFVPVPAAAWLFGSGLLGLIAVARRKVRV